MNISSYIENHPFQFIVGIFAVFFLVAFLLSALGASFEARAYRKHCNTPVTVWDALWLDLRIDECTKCEDQ